MRYLIDANILFSALYDLESNAGRLLTMAAEDKVVLISTQHVYLEMERITTAKLGFTREEAAEILKRLPVQWIERELYEDELKLALKAHPDEGDASLLACANLINCEIITGDKKLLGTKYRKVALRKLKETLDIEQKRK